MFLLKDVDRETIKMSNSKKILQYLYHKNQATKQEISKELGVSIPTVTHNVNTLIEEGYVKQVGVATSTGGRKPAVLEFIPHSKHSVGIDIRASEYEIIITNLKSEIIASRTVNIADQHMNELMVNINDCLEGLLTSMKITKEDLLGVGFALKGIVDEKNRIFEIVPNRRGEGIDFNQYRELFNTKIYIENEANVAAIAENALGVAKEMRNLVYLSINEGLGTGIVIRGYLYHGKNHRSGEFGHMVIDPKGPACDCGHKGCFETFVSTKALVKQTEVIFGKILNLGQLFTLYENNDDKALKIMDEYLEYLSIGVKNILLAIDPHYMVLGGKMSQYGHLFLEKLIHNVYDDNLFYKPSDQQIILSTLGEQSATLGASLLPLQELLYGVEKVI